MQLYAISDIIFDVITDVHWGITYIEALFVVFEIISWATCHSSMESNACLMKTTVGNAFGEHLFSLSNLIRMS